MYVQCMYVLSYIIATHAGTPQPPPSSMLLEVVDSMVPGSTTQTSKLSNLSTLTHRMAV